MLRAMAAVRTPPGTKRALSVLFVAASLALLFLRPPPALRAAIRQHGAASPAAAAAAAAALIGAAGKVLGTGGAGGGTGGAAAAAEAARLHPASGAASGGGHRGGHRAGGGRHAAAADPDDVCTGVYVACETWKRDALMEGVAVVLVGNELYQQLPTIGYGGIETSVDTIAAALFSMRIPFFAVVPGRRESAALPFRVLDTAVASNGRGGLVDAYVAQVRATLTAELAATARAHAEPNAAAVRFLTDARRAPAADKAAWLRLAPSAGSSEAESRAAWERVTEAMAAEGAEAPVAAHAPRLAIWSQSMWSQRFADLAAVALVSHHDGGGPPGGHGWDTGISNVRHRFLSTDQMDRFLDKANADEVRRVSRVVPHGLGRDAFTMCPDEGYFLWVASFDWGWKEKGIHIFLEMAKARPQYKFVGYGAARTPTGRGQITRLFEEAKSVPNFEFRGELKRGPQHLAAFCGATAFVMPTHHTIGESFGMTVIESLSKGVPVIASNNGAVPEILNIQGRDSGVSPYGATCEGEYNYDCYIAAADRLWKRSVSSSKGIHAYAWNRYDSLFVVDMLLNATYEALLEERDRGAWGG
jgi:glycosyltransferase involved in cell wall biosynthesis